MWIETSGIKFLLSDVRPLMLSGSIPVKRFTDALVLCLYKGLQISTYTIFKAAQKDFLPRVSMIFEDYLLTNRL